LLELVVSVSRLAGRVYLEHRRHGAEGSVLADLAFRGLGGWRLRPFSPASVRYPFAAPSTFDQPDLVTPDPLLLGLPEIIDEPDECGFRLVRRVYEAFGYFEEFIPREFDRKRRKLTIPG
jgi:hypothetical protein